MIFLKYLNVVDTAVLLQLSFVGQFLVVGQG